MTTFAKSFEVEWILGNTNRAALKNYLFVQSLRYAQNFVLEISIICLW
jgi:hypothetical protein